MEDAAVRDDAQRRERVLTLLIPVVSVLLALVVGGIVIACLGKNPFEGYATLFRGSLGSVQKVAASLASACPLVFTSLAAAFAYRCGVFNLGGEGQFIMGGIAASVTCLSLGIEGPLGMLAAIAAGMVAGGIWAAIPGIMKVTRGLNEMITSIMLNYVATLLMGWVYTGPFRDGTKPQTPSVADGVMLPRIAYVHVGVIIAAVVAVAVWFVIYHTSFGFKIRATGMNQEAARVNGLPIKALLLAAFVISGALAGMGGSVELLGKQYRLMNGFGAGFGFDGIAVALIAQLNPLGSLLVAVFFGILSTGATAMQVGIRVPTAIVDIIRALIIIFAVSGIALVRLPRMRGLLEGSFRAKRGAGSDSGVSTVDSSSDGEKKVEASE